MNAYILIAAIHHDGGGEAGNIGFEGITQAESIEEAIARFEYRPFHEDGVWETCLMDETPPDYDPEYRTEDDSGHVRELVTKMIQEKMKELAFKFYNVTLRPGPSYDGYLEELFKCFTVLEITPDGNVTMYPDGTKFSLQDDKPQLD